MGGTSLRTRRWTRKEYDRAVAAGILREDEPIELIAGRLIVSGLADYWIVNLVDRVVEIHREPRLEGRRWTYAARHVARPGETVSPLARPDASIAVGDLLP
jgi:hypothetical protein